MTISVWLRMAAVLSLLFAAGHSAGGVSLWSPPGETAVLQAMREFQFDAMGTNRSYLDFYLGFGRTISVYQLLQAAILWQLAGLAKKDPQAVRPVIAAFLLAGVAFTVLAWRYFFVLPVILNLALLVCLGAAFFVAGKGEKV